MKNLKDFATPPERRVHLEKELHISLENVGKSLCDDPKDIHCENLIGATSIPLGVVGPVNILLQEQTVRPYYVPLATTEGALIASVARGAKAVNACGGVQVQIDEIGVTRGPVFYTGGLRESASLEAWIRANQNVLKDEAEKTSSHLKYLGCTVKKISAYVFIRCRFDTDEAMGMNMATIATQEIVERITHETGFKCLALAGNFDVDKKPSWLNFIEGRGLSVSAEVTLSKKTVSEVLKTDVSKLYDTWLAKCIVGSIASGSMGFNAHYSNIISAMFIALGQDPAHTVEGSLGVTTTKVLSSGDLLFSVHLPSLMVGTLGGGTGLSTQKEAQLLTQVHSKSELAGLIVAGVLCGELSLMASLTEGSLAKAHKKLGR